jgi:hypothetical protein
MHKPTTADDLLPMIAALPRRERIRLIRLITQIPSRDDAAAYAEMPPQPGEFTSDESMLEWEAEGWEEFD